MKIKSLQKKLVVGFGCCLILAMVVLIGLDFVTRREPENFVLKSIRESTIDTVKANMIEKAKSIELEVVLKFEHGMNAAIVLKDIFSSVKNNDFDFKMDRNRMNHILRGVLTGNDAFTGVYSAWEPNILDQLDDIFSGQAGYDKTGRFIPYWSRNKDGRIAVEPLVDYDSQEKYDNGVRKGEYYLCPKERKQACVTPPYPYSIQNETVFITSLVAPILVKGNFLGVTGVDIRLDSIQSYIDSAIGELYSGSGEISIVTSTGILVAVSGRPELIGKPIKELYPEEWKEYLDFITNNQQAIHIEANKDAEAIVPFGIKNTDSRFGIVVRIPEEIALANVKKITHELNKMSERTVFWLITGGVIVSLIGLCVTWLMAKGIVRPIMTAINRLDETSAQIHIASKEISASSQSLAEGSSEQAASLEQTSASLEQMDSMTKQNAASARQADQLMKQSDSVVKQTRNAMDDLKGSMHEISKSSVESSKIIKTIDEIAFQTNLLALNAAVEAARAGNAGAGFAVVADEVRNLALRSAEAAKNTASLLDGTVKKVKEGSELVIKTDELFQNVANSVTKCGELVKEIAVASDEQAQGITQVNTAVAEMDKLTQQNAASAQESSSASEELRNQAEFMKGIVDTLVNLVGGKFKNERVVVSASSKPKKSGAILPSQNKPLQKRTAIKEVKPQDIIPLDEDDFRDF